ncbi:MAG: 3'-5' exonuclease [Longimicrobiales bacterium]|nr:3'-5' exonuclease [Longimicrobiales bacterium]
MTQGRLLERAARALREGPLHTLDLAREVLGLEGNPGAASAAVFTLLRSDVRFRVDREGGWELREGEDGPARGLRDEVYAVVDVETTGTSYRRGARITEVAVVEVRNGIVGDTFRTLVNPGRSIPPRISRMTGITDEMVSVAPYFDHVADEVLRRLRGRVFVAHNVSFDWGFVGNQLAEAVGEVPDVPRLCTVRMARRLVPALRRRNLDAVTAHYGIDVEARHRAYGDALATARVLLRLLDEAEARGAGTLSTLKLLLAGELPARSAPEE